MQLFFFRPLDRLRWHDPTVFLFTASDDCQTGSDSDSRMRQLGVQIVDAGDWRLFEADDQVPFGKVGFGGGTVPLDPHDEHRRALDHRQSRSKRIGDETSRWRAIG